MRLFYQQSQELELVILKGTHYKVIKQRHQGHLVLKNTLKLEKILEH